MALAIDYQSELAIFKFLEDDLRSILLTDEAEKMQLAEIIAATAPQNATESKHALQPQISDQEIALQLFASENHLALDRAYAELLHSEDASFAISMQEAQRLAAADQKARIDNEFAKMLQTTLDEDLNGNYDNCGDADSMLGQDAISEILSSDPNSKGKGKGKSKAIDLDPSVAHITNIMPPTYASDQSTSPYPSCGICGDVFQDTYSPMKAAQTANSSKRLPFGLRLPCPGEHPYCVNCLSQYVSSKLDPDGHGGVQDGRIVFPIRCPECPADKWTGGIPDTVAIKVLAKDMLDLWHYQKLLDSLPRYYCPNKSCSALVQMDETSTDPQATCPHCSMILCVPCKVEWHYGYTCEEYQDLPAEDRSAEDLLLLRLAQKEKWRRCNKCKGMIELVSGCNHITCVCGSHFCFQCGADWNIKEVKCTRGGGCQLWEDDNQLLDRDQRGGAAQQILPAAPLAAAPIFARAPALAPARAHLFAPARAPAPVYAPVYVRVPAPALAPFFARAPPAAPAAPAAPAPANAYAHLLARAFAPAPAPAPVPPIVHQFAPAHMRDPPPRYENGEFSWMHNPDGGSRKHNFTAEMLNTSSCGYCGRNHGSLRDLEAHLTNVVRHPVFSCCGRFFRQRQFYDQHRSNAIRGEHHDTCIRGENA